MPCFKSMEQSRSRKRKKIWGPKTEPCGMPQKGGEKENTKPSRLTQLLLFPNFTWTIPEQCAWLPPTASNKKAV